MDISLLIIDMENRKAQFAGANNPLYIVRNGKLTEVKANKFSIGLSITGKINKYTNHELDLHTGDSMYLFTDGFADQIGGELEEIFLYSKLRNLFLQINDKAMDQQCHVLEQAFLEWKRDLEQIDDIMIFGFKI